MSEGTSDWVIRKARVEEVAALPSLERRAAARFREVGLDAVAEMAPLPITLLELGRLEGLLWVAEHEERPIGFLLASVIDGELHIAEIDVEPAFQRRGIGRALLEHACAEARARRLPALTLLTFRGVPWCEPFYAKAGFVPIEPGAMGPKLAARAEDDASLFSAARRVAMRKALD